MSKVSGIKSWNTQSSGFQVTVFGYSVYQYHFMFHSYCRKEGVSKRAPTWWERCVSVSGSALRVWVLLYNNRNWSFQHGKWNSSLGCLLFSRWKFSDVLTNNLTVLLKMEMCDKGNCCLCSALSRISLPRPRSQPPACLWGSSNPTRWSLLISHAPKISPLGFLSIRCKAVK